MPRPALNRSVALVAVVVAALASPGAASAAVAVPTCYGQRATIVADQEGATVTGTPGRDVVVVTAAGVTVDTGGGADLVCDQTAGAQIDTGAGADRVRGGSFASTGDGPDRVEVDPNGFGGVDTGAGDDVVTGLDGGYANTQSIVTGDGDDAVRSAFTFVLRTGAGRDRVDEQAGVNTDLGEGDDHLVSRAGGEIDGGAGDDVLVGTADSAAVFFDTVGDDTFVSASRRNVVSYTFSAPVRIDLARQRSVVGSDVNTLRGIRDVAGSQGDDVILGDDGPNRIVSAIFRSDDSAPDPRDSGRDVVDGRAGDDDVVMLGLGSTVRGGVGDDRIAVNGTARGGAGADRITGSEDADDLVGGAGTDSADGADGDDRCVAETRINCER